MAEGAGSSGFQGDPASDLMDYLTGVENISELLTRTADRCKSEDLKQVCGSRFGVTHYPAYYWNPTFHCSRSVSKQSVV